MPNASTFAITPDFTLGRHVDVGSFSRLFDLATDRFREGLAIGADYAAARNRALMATEAYLTYRKEVRAGDSVTVETALLGRGATRLHLFHRMILGGDTAATCELSLVHVDRTIGGSCPFSEDVALRLEARLAEDASIVPAEVGRSVRKPVR